MAKLSCRVSRQLEEPVLSPLRLIPQSDWSGSLSGRHVVGAAHARLRGEVFYVSYSLQPGMAAPARGGRALQFPKRLHRPWRPVRLNIPTSFGLHRPWRARRFGGCEYLTSGAALP